ncbi:MAG: CsbD family protein [Bdellovibrionota bacterium]
MIWLDRKEATIEEPNNEPKTEVTPTKLEEFAKTSTAAKMSGAFNETMGSLKKNFGDLTDDAALKEAGRDQRLLGKVHRLVGSLRGVSEAATEKLNKIRKESLAICRKHGGRSLDVASDFVDDLKKLFLK